MKKYVCYPSLLVQAVLGEALLLFVALIYLSIRNAWGTVAFVAIAVAYAWMNRNALDALSLDEKGVTRYVAGIKRDFLAWPDIREVGILRCGTLKHLRKTKTLSNCCIYFSTKQMNSDERMKVCTNWPHKSVIGMKYQPDRLRDALARWDKKVILFNVSVQDLFSRNASVLDFQAQEIHY